MIHRGAFTIPTRGRGTYDITQTVREVVRKSAAKEGLATVWIQHTSASLIVCENADPTVRKDLEAFASRLVPHRHQRVPRSGAGPGHHAAQRRHAPTPTALPIPGSS